MIYHPVHLMLPLSVLAAGLLGALLYALKRRWIDALLAAAAGCALAVVLAGVRLPLAGAPSVALATGASGNASEAALLAVPQAGSITLSGDGLREAQWRDLPARPLNWQPGQADLLWLDFPRTMSLGRQFTLTARLGQPQVGWRLQLLAENKQVIAESIAPGKGLPPTTQLSVQWLPPVAEALVLQARLLDAGGKTMAQGPVPLQVKEPLPLQIQGRFDAPSFDARTLNQLLADGGAILDWQVTLGKAVSRSETARAPLTAPNALFVDAAYVEHLAPSGRAALLARVAQGLPLVVLGGNAANAGLWQGEFGLRLQPQSATTEKEDMRSFGALSLPPAGLNPDDKAAPPWSVLARNSRKLPWLWQRDWKQGKVFWIGVADWHRYAISAPQALAAWWQGAMDQIALASEQKAGWRLPDPFPVPGLRSEICAQGVKPGAALQVSGMPDSVLLARADKADAVCAAIWPQRAGWLDFSSAGVAEGGREYVYAASDWPAWQRALRREATALYAARAAAGAAAPAGDRPMPTTPWVLAFAALMLALWWREQR
ncbi:hypothetical protein ACLB1G_09640 [Oxalobacteraceae bacterium A2-2]